MIIVAFEITTNKPLFLKVDVADLAEIINISYETDTDHIAATIDDVYYSRLPLNYFENNTHRFTYNNKVYNLLIE